MGDNRISMDLAQILLPEIPMNRSACRVLNRYLRLQQLVAAFQNPNMFTYSITQILFRNCMAGQGWTVVK